MNFFSGQFFAVEVFFHQVFRSLGHRFHDHFTIRFQHFDQLRRHFGVKAAVVLSFAACHVDDIDDAAHFAAFAPRLDKRHDFVAKGRLEFFDDFADFSVFAVDFIDDDECRHVDLLQHVDGLFGADLNASQGIDDNDNGIGDFESRRRFPYEIKVTRRVDNIELMPAVFNWNHRGRN